MQIQRNTEIAWLNNTIYRLAVLIGVAIVLAFVSTHVYASDKDLLANTMGDVSATLNGTGKKWILLIDFGISLGAFAATKKPFVFFSTLGVLLAISGIGVLIQ